ncbi:diacylglycerol/lipid kinase family protein [Altericroceibacterium endophyticum]|uniref:Diacylglycerol kinase n=1 Tax=Altericroceibacterium endophyticum TaxID=1808508 RepID=A0A6I4T3W2_9SPHN|nr:diacylglycerol kinase family protein [Altericroceibacterium endophyticum]MXO65546.1 diacylglycerol kinase [Altericroceibacterium endophyticum]
MLQAGVAEPETSRLVHGLVVQRDVGAAAGAQHADEAGGLQRSKTPVPPHRVGIISNSRAHRNHVNGEEPVTDSPQVKGVLYRSPRSLPELSRTLEEFAEAGIELLIVCGGDGTLRDVITCASTAFADGMPRLALIPTGKTNALALDLDIPLNWKIADALAAAEAGHIRCRSPIEIFRPGSELPDLRGFLFGAGAFVRATGLAQRTHQAGAFSSLAVGLSVGWALAQTAFGGSSNVWRSGDRMKITAPGVDVDRDFYLLCGSTMRRLPLRLKPFGKPRDGLKVLAVDAPPRRLPIAAPALLAGSEASWLERLGYHRGQADEFTLSMEGGFILDGELYAGGDVTIRRGKELEFLVP